MVEYGFDIQLANKFIQGALALGADPGLVSDIQLDGEEINIVTYMHGYKVCGGYNTTSVPVCNTKLSNHINALIQMQYGTDGTTASIAALFSEIREELAPANMTWMYAGLKSVLPGDPAITALPPTIPGMINPLIYWTSSDLLAVNPSLLEAGMETFFTLAGRSGIQRAFATEGKDCVRNVDIPNTSLVHMKDYAAKAAFVGLVLQLILSFVSVVSFVPWLLSASPIGPAVKVVQNAEYFTTFLRSSSLQSNLEGLCNAPAHAIWQALDVVVRVGEAVGSRDDVIGVLTLDKPKMVRELVNGRKYQ